MLVEMKFQFIIIVAVEIGKSLPGYMILEQKPPTDSFTLYKNTKVVDAVSFLSNKTYKSNEECISVCLQKDSRCRSISLQSINNSTTLCKFYDQDSPLISMKNSNLFFTKKTVFFRGFL